MFAVAEYAVYCNTMYLLSMYIFKEKIPENYVSWQIMNCIIAPSIISRYFKMSGNVA